MRVEWIHTILIQKKSKMSVYYLIAFRDIYPIPYDVISDLGIVVILSAGL